ncbi:hypothetical protein B0O79_0058 [Flavobacteriaceae bacterium MAR_2009_75]|nr:hypothetical protein B0O79_0058 [Flavobacteriaceae bacterium MAR_2009_75]
MLLVVKDELTDKEHIQRRLSLDLYIISRFYNKKSCLHHNLLSRQKYINSFTI